MQTKWVEFVGGPLHGQCRNIPIDATHWNAHPRMPAHCTPYEEDVALEKEASYVTYKIEMVCCGRPGTVGYRESFKGVLV